jgi:hypothetical protein
MMFSPKKEQHREDKQDATGPCDKSENHILFVLGFGGLRATISNGAVPDMLRAWPFPFGGWPAAAAPRVLISLDRRFEWERRPFAGGFGIWSGCVKTEY